MKKRGLAAGMVLLSLQLFGDLHVALLSKQTSVRLAPIFNDGAVLQCDMPVNIWGIAEPGETILVSFAGQEKQAVASESGRWQVVLDPMASSSEPRKLTAASSISNRDEVELGSANAGQRSGNQQSAISNVVVGEVWLATGQSNMVMPLHETLGGSQRMEERIPEIRFMVVPRVAGLPAETNRFSAADLKWNAFEPGPNGQIAAVAFYFAEKIQAETGRPVGIIQSSRGGTPCEAWTPLWALEENPALEHYADALREALSAGRTRAEWMEDPNYPGNPFSARTASSLYDNMIRPLIPYTARGVIWYQGEGNAHNPDEYRVLFPAMINAWREEWNRPDWPFYFVQLAAFGGRLHNDWPGLRAAQAFTRDTVPHTGMAVAIDVGEKDDIHPPNKQPVGERLARLALADVYGRDVFARGPAFQSLEKSDSGVRVLFTWVENGLQTSDGKAEVPGFEVAAEDAIPSTEAPMLSYANINFRSLGVGGANVDTFTVETVEDDANRMIYSNNFSGTEYRADGMEEGTFGTSTAVSGGRLIFTDSNVNAGFRVDLRGLGLATNDCVTAVRLTIKGSAPVTSDAGSYLGLGFANSPVYNMNGAGLPLIAVTGDGRFRATGGAGFGSTNNLADVALGNAFTPGGEFTMSLIYHKNSTMSTWYNGVQIHARHGPYHPVKAKIISKDTVELTGWSGDAPVAVRYGWANFPEPPLTLQNSAGLPAEPFLLFK